MRNFLGGSPDPVFLRFGNRIRAHRINGLLHFLSSHEFAARSKRPQGCLLNRREPQRELHILRSLHGHATIRRGLTRLYSRIACAMKSSSCIVLISRASALERKKGTQHAILLHEFIHVLLERNGIRMRSWKWNEGLVTFLTYFALERQLVFPASIRPRERSGRKSMYQVYQEYARKWAALLQKVNLPMERKSVIRQILRLNVAKINP